MKKFFKTIILLPMWPLIWKQKGFSLENDCWASSCNVCGDNGCCRRANAMLEWWRA